jgi:hypothetical protein
VHSEDGSLLLSEVWGLTLERRHQEASAGTAHSWGLESSRLTHLTCLTSEQDHLALI